MKNMIEAAIKSIVKELLPAEGVNLAAREYEIINVFDCSDTLKYEFDDEGSEELSPSEERRFDNAGFKICQGT